MTVRSVKSVSTLYDIAADFNAQAIAIEIDLAQHTRLAKMLRDAAQDLFGQAELWERELNLNPCSSCGRGVAELPLVAGQTMPEIVHVQTGLFNCDMPKPELPKRVKGATFEEMVQTGSVFAP